MSLQVRFRLDRSRPVAAQVFEHLRTAIITLDLAPGTHLSRATLGERFGVSSTPLRDALLKLEEEGLVDVFPQHATAVSRIDLAHAYRGHFLRRSLELEVVATLASRADRSFARPLRTMLVRQRMLVDSGDLGGMSLSDTGFHLGLCEAAGVDRLWAVIRRESSHLDRLRNLHLPIPGKADAIFADHDAILSAVEAGRVEEAREAVRRHLSGTLANVDELRARHPDYFVDDAEMRLRAAE